MTRRQNLAKDALMRASRLRRAAGIGPNAPVCMVDLATAEGVEVRFLDVPSLEGMYSREPEPVIIISSLRPAGRQAFTCGHELGHHVYGHGLRVDELIEAGGTVSEADEEFQVQCFSGFLLMPKAAVVRGFERRGWDVQHPRPEQVFVVAGWLGVGYETLITHMHLVLRIVSEAESRRLRRTAPKSIKAALLGEETTADVVVADELWEGRAVDLQVGDEVLAAPGVVWESGVLEESSNEGRATRLRAVKPGQGRLIHVESGWSSFVRVTRRGYVGRAVFRFQEEVPDEDEYLRRG